MDEKQAIDLLWDEWKYRHELFWKSLFRWGGAVITLWIIPFLKPEVFKPYPIVSLLFPAMGFLLSLFSAWLLGAEQRRFAMVNQKYHELRGAFLPPRVPRLTRLDRLYALPIGAKVVPLYALLFGVLSVVVGVLLWHSIQVRPLTDQGIPGC